MESRVQALQTNCVGLAPAGNPWLDKFKQVNDRVNRYDKAAHQPSFVQEWKKQAETLGGRRALSIAADKICQPSIDNPVSQGILKCLGPVAENAYSEGKLLGIDTQMIGIGPGKEIGRYSDFLTKEGRQVYTDTVRDNFSSFLSKDLRRGFTPTTLAKRVLVGQNAFGVVENIETGGFFKGICSLGAMGLAGYSVLSKTEKAYKEAKAEHKGALETMASTAGAFVGQSLKAVACWEAANVGAFVGVGLCPVAGIPVMAASVAMGSLFSAAAYTALSRVIPDAKKQAQLGDLQKTKG